LIQTPCHLNTPTMALGILKTVALVGCLIVADGFSIPTTVRTSPRSTSCQRGATSYDETQHHHEISLSVMDRRQTVAAIISSSWVLGTTASNASDDNDNSSSVVQPTTTPLLKGLVTLEDGTQLLNNPEMTTSSSSSALYVTCRPNKPDNVPGAILSGTRGKPPPVMAARYENPTFPFEFTLSAPTDMTMEGASVDGIPNSSPVLDPEKFWWKDDDLIVSARWDSDGVAATRSSEDLVGRGFWKKGTGDDSSTQVVLTGRGAFGKFATGKSK
jgi:hypothetical protein